MRTDEYIFKPHADDQHNDNYEHQSQEIADELSWGFYENWNRKVEEKHFRHSRKTKCGSVKKGQTIQTLFVDPNNPSQVIITGMNSRKQTQQQQQEQQQIEIMKPKGTRRPIQSSQILDMKKLLSPTSTCDSSESRKTNATREMVMKRSHKGTVVDIYPDPDNPTHMIEIYLDKNGKKKKLIHKPPPAKMTLLQRLGLQSCNRATTTATRSKPDSTTIASTEPEVEFLSDEYFRDIEDKERAMSSSKERPATSTTTRRELAEF